MHKIQFLNPGHIVAGGHYSSIARVGPLVFTAGHVPRDENRTVIGSTIAEQTTATLSSIKDSLSAFNVTLEDIIQVRVHLSDLSLASEFNAAYADFFGAHKPTRTVVGSQLNGVMVEIDIVAYTSS